MKRERQQEEAWKNNKISTIKLLMGNTRMEDIIYDARPFMCVPTNVYFCAQQTMTSSEAASICCHNKEYVLTFV